MCSSMRRSMSQGTMKTREGVQLNYWRTRQSRCPSSHPRRSSLHSRHARISEDIRASQSRHQDRSREEARRRIVQPAVAYASRRRINVQTGASTMSWVTCPRSKMVHISVLYTRADSYHFLRVADVSYSLNRVGTGRATTRSSSAANLDVPTAHQQRTSKHCSAPCYH
ncbi:hypothetical protein FA95DRAFT_561681 [Auriscalpium vulgare]|uniref:Uncharacterized protein n=1 Tax=Auriscalpium vulgare TaxID=40419 RepID=A0ACB8RF44_9AGAM|nr:hypothetical protein FA95DRAFT_561681 [Auriscalpium vulgare]